MISINIESDIDARLDTNLNPKDPRIFPDIWMALSKSTRQRQTHFDNILVVVGYASRFLCTMLSLSVVQAKLRLPYETFLRVGPVICLRAVSDRL